MDLGRAIGYTPIHHLLLEAYFPTDAHDGLGDSDSQYAETESYGVCHTGAWLLTSTHINTRGVVRVFV